MLSPNENHALLSRTTSFAVVFYREIEILKEGFTRIHGPIISLPRCLSSLMLLPALSILILRLRQLVSLSLYSLSNFIPHLKFFTNPAGFNSNGQAVYLRDIWPTRSEIQEIEKQFVLPKMFKEVYGKITVSCRFMR